MWTLTHGRALLVAFVAVPFSFASSAAAQSEAPTDGMFPELLDGHGDPR